MFVRTPSRLDPEDQNRATTRLLDSSHLPSARTDARRQPPLTARVTSSGKNSGASDALAAAHWAAARFGRAHANPVLTSPAAVSPTPSSSTSHHPPMEEIVMKSTQDSDRGALSPVNPNVRLSFNSSTEGSSPKLQASRSGHLGSHAHHSFPPLLPPRRGYTTEGDREGRREEREGDDELALELELMRRSHRVGPADVGARRSGSLNLLGADAADPAVLEPPVGSESLSATVSNNNSFWLLKAGSDTVAPPALHNHETDCSNLNQAASEAGCLAASSSPRDAPATVNQEPHVALGHVSVLNAIGNDSCDETVVAGSQGVEHNAPFGDTPALGAVSPSIAADAMSPVFHTDRCTSQRSTDARPSTVRDPDCPTETDDGVPRKLDYPVVSDPFDESPQRLVPLAVRAPEATCEANSSSSSEPTEVVDSLECGESLLAQGLSLVSPAGFPPRAASYPSAVASGSLAEALRDPRGPIVISPEEQESALLPDRPPPSFTDTATPVSNDHNESLGEFDNAERDHNVDFSVVEADTEVGCVETQPQGATAVEEKYSALGEHDESKPERGHKTKGDGCCIVA
jgi:hypothetical protein